MFGDRKLDKWFGKTNENALGVPGTEILTVNPPRVLLAARYHTNRCHAATPMDGR